MEDEEEEQEERLGEEDGTDAVPEFSGDRDRRDAVARSAAKDEAKRKRGKGGKKRKGQKRGEKIRSRERAGEGRVGRGRVLWGSHYLSRSLDNGDGYGDGGIVLTIPAYFLSSFIVLLADVLIQRMALLEYDDSGGRGRGRGYIDADSVMDANTINNNSNSNN